MLDELLSCCPDTGQFRRLVASGTQRAGAIAGSINSHGYVVISAAGQRYKAHHLAWFCSHGCWPIQHIDHINRDKTDNRITNLREATPQQNRVNTTTKRTSKSGVKGVEVKRGKFVAAIRINGVRHHLGTFATTEQAQFVYQVAARNAFGEFLPRPA